MARDEERLEDASDEEDEDFDPEAGAAAAPGNELEDSDAEEEEEEQEDTRRSNKGRGKAGGSKRGGKAKKRGRNIFIDDAAEEDDDEEDDEERAPKRGKSGAKVSRYVDVMAAEDRDAEEEDEEDAEENFDDLIANDGEADLARQEQHGNYQRVTELRRKENELTEEELEEFVRQKYQTTNYTAAADEGEDVGVVGQQGLLPSKTDARLWAVQCRPGCEREAVICILQKAFDFAAHDARLGLAALGIKSAFAHDHIKGYIWVEAHKLDYVRDALKGLRTIFHSKVPKQVPLAEMVEAISVPKPAQTLLERESWARVRNGLYKDDLARVIDVDHSSGRATIEVVPRVDYAAIASGAPKQPFGRAPKIRPPARPFNPGEAREAGGLVERENRRLDGSIFYVLDGKQRFRSGYLQRTVAIRSLTVCDTLPPLDELQRFKQASSASEQDGTPGDLSSLMDSLKDSEAPAPKFVKGDRVEVVSGDLIGLKGRVERLGESGTVFVKPFLKEMDEAIEMEPRDLQKFFKDGDHVKAVAGQFAGETGMVVSLEDGVAVVFLDSSKKEARLFARDLTESADIVAGIDRLGPYEQHDLVLLDGAAGVIIECGPDSVRVLTNRGTPERPEIRTARLPDIKKKLNARNIVSNDLGLNPVSVGDVVDVKRGGMSDKSGTVRFIWRGFLFLHSREVKLHNGFFCVSARDCRVRGAKQSNGLANPLATPGRVSDIIAGLRSPGPGRTPNVMASPRLGAGGQTQTLTGTSGGGGFSGRSAGPRRDDGLVGRSLPIARGPHRGYKGRVVSATETHVRMELEAQYKTVTVKRSDLRLEGDGHVAPSVPSSPWDTPTTPMHAGGRTPMHSGAQTPMHAWGSATPMHSGSMTPSRAPMTPGRETPGHGSAWAPTQTPMRPSDAPATPGTWGPDYTTPGGSFQSTPNTYGDTPQQFAGTPAYTPIGTPRSSQYTPGGTAQYSPTPGGAAGTPSLDAPYSPTANGTPAAYTPVASTPGTPGGGYTPWSSGTADLAASAAAAASGEAALWRDVHVALPDGRTGVVRDVAPGGEATVALGETTEEGLLRVSSPEEAATAPVGQLGLVAPRKRQLLRVVRGGPGNEGVPLGMVATLVNMSGDECIVKQEGTGGDHDIKVISKATVGRLVAAGEA